MELRTVQTSSLDRVLAASLAAFSMFVVGYTATRVYLAQPASQDAPVSTALPHQAAMWSALGK
ncbi:MAG: hypothetical protein F6J97_15415 [Leptolyngbya sp. SIO4C1]|nr:hypothetical protein [Leptolyngbya sp. SIO4C1]